MSRHPFLQPLAIVAALTVGSSLLWTSIRAEQNSPQPEPKPDRQEQPDDQAAARSAKPGNAEAGQLTEALGGTERYLTHLSTDKPVYKPGEKLYLRGTVLHAVKHTPLPETLQSPAMIQILGPKGETVAQGMTQPTDSVLGYAWEV
ncbi:MAG: hypothetical protein KDA79_18035, partial [Planctomycetaceae bacterium]|nr:hypothetical protein [Planctomycetaceae bacterium]